MTKRNVLLWLASVIVVALIASTITAAQVLRGVRPLDTPRVVSGDNLGFRIEGLRTDEAGTPTGRLVIQVDGEWVEVALGGGGGAQPIR